MFPKMKLILVIITFFVVISRIQITHAEQVKSKYDDLVTMYQGRKESSGIKLEDSAHDVIMKLAVGNYGAVKVLVEYLKAVNDIEEEMFHPLIFLLMFYSLGITESKIWMLYKYVCHENIVCVHACLRSVQLGILQEGELYFAIENRGAELNIKELFTKLQARLANFKLPSEASNPGVEEHQNLPASDDESPSTSSLQTASGSFHSTATPGYFDGYYGYGTVIFAGVTAVMFYLYHENRRQYHRARE